MLRNCKNNTDCRHYHRSTAVERMTLLPDGDQWMMSDLQNSVSQRKTESINSFLSQISNHKRRSPETETHRQKLWQQSPSTIWQFTNNRYKIHYSFRFKYTEVTTSQWHRKNTISESEFWFFTRHDYFYNCMFSIIVIQRNHYPWTLYPTFTKMLVQLMQYN